MINGKEVMTEHYYSQPFEIAAQYAGMRSANVFLESKWGLGRAESALCQLHNRIVDDKTCYLSDGTYRDSVGQILCDLNEEFKTRVFALRPYDPGKDPEDLVNRSGYPDIIVRKLSSLTYGLQEDWLMASLLAKFMEKAGFETKLPNVKALYGLEFELEQVLEILAADGLPIDESFMCSELNLAMLKGHVALNRVG